MGTSIVIVGFVPPDDEYKKKLAAYRACESAGVDIPEELEKFFNYESPDDRGVKLSRKQLGDAVRDWNNEDADGYEVEIAKLPPNVKIVSFFCSY